MIDGHDLVGIVSQGDLAKNIDEEEVGELVEAISAAEVAARGRARSSASAGRPGGPRGW